MISDKLRLYLDSKGNHLPHNFSSHRHTHNCLFCDAKTEDDFEVMFYPVKDSGKQSVSTGTLACQTCAVPIIRMEQEKGATRKSGLFTTDLYERHRLYLRCGRFDETVGMHLIERDIGISPLQYKCYFCKSTHIIAPSKLIQVPVDFDKENGFTGGAVQVCNGCHTELIDSEDCVIPLEDIPKVHYVEWTCGQCSGIYYTTKTENEYRHYNKKSDYLCPNCTYNQVLDYDFQYFSISSHSTIERTMLKICDFCSSEFYLDMARPASALEKDHLTPKKRLMCESCASYGPDGPLESIKVSETNVLLVYDVPGRYKRYMFRLKNIKSGKVTWEQAYTGKLIDLVVEVLSVHLKAIGRQEAL